LVAPEHPKHDGRQAAGVYTGGRGRTPGATTAKHRHDCRTNRLRRYVPASGEARPRPMGIVGLADLAPAYHTPPVYSLLSRLLLGVIIGVVAIRRQGIYFAMITLAMAQMFYFFCLQAPFTNGEDGIQGFSRGHLFGLIDLNNTMNLYYFIATVTVLSLLLIWRI